MSTVLVPLRTTAHSTNDSELGECQTRLADDLRVHVQSISRIFPLFPIQIGPFPEVG